MFPNGTDYYVSSEVDYRRELLRASWGHRPRGRRATGAAPHRRTGGQVARSVGRLPGTPAPSGTGDGAATDQASAEARGRAA